MSFHSMIDALVSKSTTPAGGWKYVIEEHGIEIEGESFEDLVGKTKEVYRFNKQQVPDDLESRIVVFICENSPKGTCKGGVAMGSKVTFQQMWNGSIAFVLLMRQGYGGLVDEEEMERRAGICAECPMNEMKDVCLLCKGMDALIRRVSHGRSSQYDDKLGICVQCGCLVRAVIQVDKKILDSATNRSTVGLYPDKCWKKKLLTEK